MRQMAYLEALGHIAVHAAARVNFAIAVVLHQLVLGRCAREGVQGRERAGERCSAEAWARSKSCCHVLAQSHTSSRTMVQFSCEFDNDMSERGRGAVSQHGLFSQLVVTQL